MSLITTFLLAHALLTGQPEQAQMPYCAFTGEDSVAVVSVRDSIVDYAKSYLGTPYKYGQASPSGFDCTGFTWFVFNHFNVQIPRCSRDYVALGKRVPIENCQKGDLILFTGTDPAEKRVGHVGIIISNVNGQVQFIHSSSSDNHFGVVITDYYNSAYPKRFVGVCSVLP